MMQQTPEQEVTTPLARGQTALAQGAWSDAVTALTEAVTLEPRDAAAWEYLGNAFMWLRQTEREIDARQRAYGLYRERGDDVSSARVCLDLVWDYAELRGEEAVANGWFQRAQRLLDTLPESAEHALLGVFRAYMGSDSDPAAAEQEAARAAALAQRVGAHDIGALALAQQGLSLVMQGRVGAGMSLLDEAVASCIGREIVDPQWFYFTCCCMIDACDRVRDFGRSLQWCERLHAFAKQWNVSAFLTTCRVKYTGALLWRGEWPRCEAELTAALQELGDERPTLAAGAVVRLADLRRRQGRVREAESLLEGGRTHELAAAVRMALALEAGDVEMAADLAARVLRRTAPSARTERVAALEHRVRACVRLGRLADAQEAAAELSAVAAITNTPGLRAASLTADAMLEAAAARHERARVRYEDAIHLLEESGSAYEAGLVRIDLAATLESLGRREQAAAELGHAARSLEAVGAASAASRARAALTRAEQETGDAHAASGPLTRRQRQVLNLVAEGLANREIAERLCLSEHTVHRHVANVLSRLGVTTRSAAVARAVRADMLQR